MEQSSFQDEQTVRHQFDSLCKLALKSEVINYEKHMAYRQKYEVMLSELSEKELSRLFIMDEHEMETHRFQVLGYDIEVKDALIAEALQTLTEKKRNILYFESSKRKVFIVTREETFEFYGKLNEIENSLKVCKISFLRVHQSFLVNYKHIKGQSYDFVVMDNGKKISISEDRRKLISEQYCSMEDTYYVDR